MSDFIPFPKIPRLSREIVITEKIDGTNALVFIDESGEFRVGSRSRWITPQQDNYGFAAWAYANKEELLKLGPGRHFGEWWGQGIQRNYGLKEKRFSLFNVLRWSGDELPSCCDLVPILRIGSFATDLVDEAMDCLKRFGSRAAPGFMNPEGIIVHHTAGNHLFKKTLLKDEKPKTQEAEKLL